MEERSSRDREVKKQLKEDIRKMRNKIAVDT